MKNKTLSTLFCLFILISTYSQYPLLNSKKKNTEIQENTTVTNPLSDVQAYFFTSQDTICLNSSITITNTSTNASSYYWNFCSGNIDDPPAAVNLGNVGGNLNIPVFTDIVFANNNYYVFVINYSPASLVRLDFGNSMLNTPTSVNLGNFGGIIPDLSEGIKVVNNQNKWYAIIVGGSPAVTGGSHIVKIDFGANLSNSSPVATDWGNIGGLYHPMELHISQENNRWLGFTVNSENSTLTKLDFGNSFENVPTGINLGNIGNMDHPGGINVINDSGKWWAFTVNSVSNTITRLDFGNSLSNIPTGMNLGNPGGALQDPRDLYIIKHCDQTVAFITNGQPNAALLKMDFNNDFSSIPQIASYGNLGDMNFPHSISNIFRVKDELYSFITNAGNNTITRLQFSQCTNANPSSSTLHTPPPITYNTPGTYNINLTVDEGLPTQASFCKQIVVLPAPKVDFSFDQDICNPGSVAFKNESTGYKSLSWDFGNSFTSQINNPIVNFDPFGAYTIKLKALAEGGCADSITKSIPTLLKKGNIIMTSDTILCDNGPFQIKSISAFKYCWSPSPTLSATNISSPVISGTIPKTTYFLNALVMGENLISNGDFTLGNTGFNSEYQYSQTSGYNEGIYTVGANVKLWHNGLNDCKDHTGNNGNMMLINGSGIAGIQVWHEKIQINANTNYAFSTWLQSLLSLNPSQLQFYINGVLIGNVFNASPLPCTWTRFYSLWNSGSATTAEIAIINQNTSTSGNDFALDDISFGELQMLRDSVTVTINPNPKVTFDYNIPFCKTVQLTGREINAPDPIVDWNWNFGEDGQSETANTLTHSYQEGGEHVIKLVAVDENSCKDTTTQTIRLDTIKAMISPDTLVCKNALVTLRASGGTIYDWAPSAGMLDPASSGPRINVDETTRYHLTIKNEIGCEDTASVLINVKPRPAFVKPADASVCMDSTIRLKGSNGDIYHYLWSPGETLDDPSAVNPLATPLNTTQYQLTITEAPCGYDTSFNINVLVNPNPSVTASRMWDIDCINPTTPLNAQGSGSKYEWSPASGVDHPFNAAVSASADSTTTFIVKNTNEFNCSAYASVIVKVTNTAKPVFVVPNAFTPNNDGINDCFGIRQWGNVIIHDFSIYNRWGKMVFTTKNPRDCWNGTCQGLLQPGGGYVYIIRAKSFCGELVRKGNLILVR